MCSKKDYKKMYQNVTKVLFNYGITDAYYLSSFHTVVLYCGKWNFQMAL